MQCFNVFWKLMFSETDVVKECNRIDQLEHEHMST